MNKISIDKKFADSNKAKNQLLPLDLVELFVVN